MKIVTEKRFQLQSAKACLVVGAGHGIGYELVRNLRRLAPSAVIFGTYRRKEKASSLLSLASQESSIRAIELDPSQEGNVEALSKRLFREQHYFDLIINSVGVLHDDRVQPEKSVKECSTDKLLHYFAINACLTPLLGKHFLNHLRGQKLSAFVTLSAKVGSIGDNRLGGWYGYRASKAALNQFVRTLGREFEARRINAISLAIHPGTTITEMSKQFISSKTPVVHLPATSAKNILLVFAHFPKNFEFPWWYDDDHIPPLEIPSSQGSVSPNPLLKVVSLDESPLRV